MGEGSDSLRDFALKVEKSDLKRLADSRRCGHCGREDTLEHIKDVVLNEGTTEIVYSDPRGEVLEVIQRPCFRILSVQLCAKCAEPTLATYRDRGGGGGEAQHLAGDLSAAA